MKVTLPNPTPQSNGKNMAPDKETIKVIKVVGVLDNHIRTLVEARFYMGRSRNSSTVYASFWVHGGDYLAGHAKAGGWGYHKQSAALGSAIRNAGITLDASIDGVGEAAMQDALVAIAAEVFPDATLLTIV